MGILQRAVETYDFHEDLVGKVEEGKTPLAPVGHTITNAQIEITIDKDGRFVSASAVDKDMAKTIIPVTEESAGRSSTGAKERPHPLCDKLKYLTDDPNYYIPQLEDWISSEFNHPKLQPILKYVKGGTIIADLDRAGLLNYDKNGKLKTNEDLVRWGVNGLEDGTKAECWLDKTLFDAFIEYYRDKKNTTSNICMVSGNIELPTSKYPGLFFGTSKLISFKEEGYIKHSGRFTKIEQALTTGYLSIQKAYNSLSWLAENQGESIGGKHKILFLCWNPQGTKLRPSTRPLIDRQRENKKTDRIKPSDYKERLKNTIINIKRDNQLTGMETAVIAFFDHATKGRVSLNYYSEFSVDDFLIRMRLWDEICCCYHRTFGTESPAIQDIVNLAYGTLQNKKIIADDKIFPEKLQRTVISRLSGSAISNELEKLLVNKANHLELYGDDEKWNYLRSTLLHTTCSVIRKYRYDYYGEELSMEYDKSNDDRSYQYGALLAIMEKIERDTYEKGEKREPNAMRLQTAFAQRPQHTHRVIMEMLQEAYIPKLKVKTRIYYKNLIGEIMGIIAESPEYQLDMPLDDTYIMGYYLMRNKLYTKSDKNEEEKQNEYIAE